MRPFAATSILLQDPDVIEDGRLRSGVPCAISLTSALGGIADRALVSGHSSMPDRAGSHHDEEKFGSQKGPRITDFRSECRDDHFIVGMTNSAPLLMPEGQRAVTVLVFVQNLIESVPCWLRSPKLEAFQPPKE